MLAKYRPLFAPLAVIAAGIALAGLFWWIGRPGSQYKPIDLNTVMYNVMPKPPARPMRPVTTLPGLEDQIEENPAVLRCYLLPTQGYVTRKFLITRSGAKYAMIETNTNCYGWIFEGY